MRFGGFKVSIAMGLLRKAHQAAQVLRKAHQAKASPT